MIAERNVIQMRISKNEMAVITEMSRAACRGGVSRIRSGADRADALFEDQLVGQIGTFAGNRFWFGHSHQYLIGRHVANLNPNAGDGGSDIIGANVDFKASKIRSDRPMLDYRLVVRPQERAEGKVYVQLLVDMTESVTAYILGWASDDMLPPAAREGVFAGAHVLPARELQPLPPVRWLWMEAAHTAQGTARN